MLHRIRYKDIEQPPPINIPKDFKQDFQGSSPAPFIGRYGYPMVNIGLLSPQYSGDTSHYDSPRLWSRGNFKIDQVASMRYSLVNSRTQANVKQLHGRFLELCKEVGMAAKAVELEIHLKDKPKLSEKAEREIIPFGPAGEVKKAEITANATVDSRVEKIVRDTDLKAVSGILDLYKKGFEENFLSKILSVGNLGTSRKLVPTRWSITAVDDTLGRNLIQEIKDYSKGEYAAHFGGGWGNYYLILFFPEVWSYELFETYLNKNVNLWSRNGYAYSTDYENYNGRKTYAEECAGGYYACRLPILEKLKGWKRQCSVLALRFITEEYTQPLGVWVCREATRKSLAQSPLRFASQELMIKYAEELLKRKFGFDLQFLSTESKLLKNKSKQKKLREFT